MVEANIYNLTDFDPYEEFSDGGIVVGDSGLTVYQRKKYGNKRVRSIEMSWGKNAIEEFTLSITVNELKTKNNPGPTYTKGNYDKPHTYLPETVPSLRLQVTREEDQTRAIILQDEGVDEVHFVLEAAKRALYHAALETIIDPFRESLLVLDTFVRRGRSRSARRNWTEGLARSTSILQTRQFTARQVA